MMLVRAKERERHANGHRTTDVISIVDTLQTSARLHAACTSGWLTILSSSSLLSLRRPNRFFIACKSNNFVTLNMKFVVTLCRTNHCTVVTCQKCFIVAAGEQYTTNDAKINTSEVYWCVRCVCLLFWFCFERFFGQKIRSTQVSGPGPMSRQ